VAALSRKHWQGAELCEPELRSCGPPAGIDPLRPFVRQGPGARAYEPDSGLPLHALEFRVSTRALFGRTFFERSVTRSRSRARLKMLDAHKY
jgi:hypothetical protein